MFDDCLDIFFSQGTYDHYVPNGESRFVLWFGWNVPRVGFRDSDLLRADHVCDGRCGFGFGTVDEIVIFGLAKCHDPVDPQAPCL